MTRRHWLLIALAIFLALAFSACGSRAKQAAPTRAAQPGAAAPTAAPAKVAPAATTAADAEPLTVTRRDAGLDKLTSFRLTWHAEWTSTDQGKTESGAWDWAEEYTAAPKAIHFSTKSPDPNDPAKINLFEVWQIGDITYMMTGDDEKCISISSEGTANSMEKGMFNPSMLGAIHDATYLGQDTVNGIPARHYKYTSKAGTLVGLGEVSGETWVAVDGGYVVRDMVTWKGGSGPFGGLTGASSANGEGKWLWELSDANQPFEIKPAAGCRPPAALDLPMMPDAAEKSQFGELVTYKTAGKVADVVAFYKDSLAAAGWTLEGEPTEMGDVAMLNFTRDGKTLSVTVSTSDNTTQVMLNLSE